MRALTLAMLTFLVIANLIHTLPVQHPGPTDLDAFLRAGNQARSGLPPYAGECLTVHGQAYCLPNGNPPATLFLFMPLSTLDRLTAHRLVYGLNLMALALLTFMLIALIHGSAHPRRLLWLLAFAPLWEILANGQIYLLLTLAVVGAYVALSRREAAIAGVLIGVTVAIKPNFGIWPVLLFLAGERRAAVFAGVTTIALNLPPLLIWGPGVYADWLTAAGTIWPGLPANASLIGLAERLNLPLVGKLTAALLVLTAVVWTWRVKADARTVSDRALLVGLIASPIAWAAYGMFLLPALWRRSWHGPLARSILALWLIPIVPIWWLASHGNTTVFLVLGSFHALVLACTAVFLLHPSEA